MSSSSPAPSPAVLGKRTHPDDDNDTNDTNVNTTQVGSVASRNHGQPGQPDTSLSTQVRKKTKPNEVSQVQTEVINTTIDDALSLQHNTINKPESIQINQLHSEIVQLKLVIKSQSDEIVNLNNKLSAVLKYLEIGDIGQLMGSDAPPSSSNGYSTTDQSSSSSVTVSTGHLSSSSGAIINGNGNNDGGANSSGIGRRPTSARAAAVSAAVTAIYVEQSVKKRRASSLIVSGMPIVSSASDEQQFTKLCQSEFGVNPDIAYNKRLGPPKPGRFQPLLVALRTEDAARQLIDRARQLRHSSDNYVRTNIYINANLTRAEANAAYQFRQQRRQRSSSSSATVLPAPVVGGVTLYSIPSTVQNISTMPTNMNITSISDAPTTQSQQ